MPDEYEGLSREEIAAIKGDDDTSGSEDSPPKDKRGDEDKKISGEEDKDDNMDKSNIKQPDDNADKRGNKADDAEDSQDGDGVADKKDVDKTKEAGSDEIQGPDADKKLDDDTEITDAKPDAPKEQKPFVSTLPEVDIAELERLKTELDEAKKKFADGEIDYSELDVVKDKYNELKWTAEFTRKSNISTRETLWKWEQDRFFDDNSKFRDNTTLNAAFVAVVNNIIATDEGAKLSDRQVLAKAKQLVETDLGILGERQTTGAINEKKRTALAKAKKANADRSELPADIGALPSAAENVDTDPFAYLDKLDGEKYQAAINKLTPEQLQRYEDSH